MLLRAELHPPSRARHETAGANSTRALRKQSPLGIARTLTEAETSRHSPARREKRTLVPRWDSEVPGAEEAVRKKAASVMPEPAPSLHKRAWMRWTGAGSIHGRSQEGAFS